MIDFLPKTDCCGCTACASACGRSAISMREDCEGFLYPSVDGNKCVHCGLCVKVCPIVRRDKCEHNYTEPKVYALRHKNEGIWKKSSSGGVFSALSNYILSQGGCVFGAKYNEHWEVVHAKVETLEQASAFRGSKYVQSDMRDIYPMVKGELMCGRLVLFSGTPCQCEGLRGYLRKEYGNLYIVDIMCHCVPSPKVFADYIKFIQKKAGASICAINMKDKTLGWGNQTPRIYFDNGKEWFNSPETRLWNSIFYSRLATRPSCYHCRFTNYMRSGDITIGDFWGIEEAHPDFYDKRGVSFIFTNNEKGLGLFHSVSDRFVYRESHVTKCIQPQLKCPVNAPEQREQFWHDYTHMKFRRLCAKHFQYGLFNTLRRWASKVKHRIITR